MKNSKLSLSEITDIYGINKANHGFSINSVYGEMGFVLRKKYPIIFNNVEIIKLKNDNKKIIRKNSGIIKISTKNKTREHFDFSLLTKNLFPKESYLKTENEKFNEIFQPRTNNPLKMIEIFTPLAMELALEIYKEKTEVGTPIVVSFDNDVFLQFDTRKYDFFSIISSNKVSLNIDKMTNIIYENIVKNTYNFYYILSFISINSYLD